MQTFKSTISVLLVTITISTYGRHPKSQRVSSWQNFSTGATTQRWVGRRFLREQIVPDVIDFPPNTILHINYGGLNVNFGNEMTPSQTRNQPSVSWIADSNKYYLLCMTDPDVPSRAEPTLREVQHWIVTNVPGSDVNAGEVITQYVGPATPSGTGLHRYVFLLYEQPGKLTFDEPRIGISVQGRPNFSIRNFARKYNLENITAGNYFQAQWDTSVPEYQRLLGITP